MNVDSDEPKEEGTEKTGSVVTAREPDKVILDELIERAEAAFDAEQAEKQTKRMFSGQFTLEDFSDQLKSMRKMGPLSKIFDMLPGDLGKAARQVDPKEAEKSIKVTEAILSSMTPFERKHPDVLNASRKRRIAAGAGVDVPAVNRLLKQFRDSQKMMKFVKKTGGKGLSGLFR